jgi:BON domain
MSWIKVLFMPALGRRRGRVAIGDNLHRVALVANCLWVLGERRLVTLMGCVQTKEQAEAMERAVWLVDDVMGVVNYLIVGTQAKPLYKVAAPK